MKSYLEKYSKVGANGPGEEMTQSFVTWEKEGQTLVGKFLYSEVVSPKEGMDPVNRYVFDTDNGTESCLLGGATDKQLSNKLTPGDLLSITYKGKKSFDGGKKQVNNFEIRRWGHEDV